MDRQEARRQTKLGVCGDRFAHQIEIILDPKQAFGTGHHATTCMLLEWLEGDVIHGGETVLDVGTGGGLLAMVALRLGAVQAVGIDPDPEAIDCAHEYASVNGFRTGIVSAMREPYGRSNL